MVTETIKIAIANTWEVTCWLSIDVLTFYLDSF